MVLVYYKY